MRLRHTAAMRILLIEDHCDIAETIGDYLRGAGHRCDFALDGITGLHLAVSESFDVIILDLMLPGIDGLSLARRLRQDAGRQTPLLMLTARDTLNDRLAGFAAGCDDYLVKPFALEELLARLLALHRRAQGAGALLLQSADLQFDTRTLQVRRGSRSVNLKPMGRKLLQLLLEANGAVCSRDALEQALWGEQVPEGDALRVHIHALRQAVDQAGEPPLIHTVRGAGYRLALEP